MAIITRLLLLDNKPPIKAYIDSEGFYEAYGYSMTSGVINASRHLVEVLQNNDFTTYAYLLALVWGNIQPGLTTPITRKAVNLWGHYDYRNQGNPIIDSFTHEDGVRHPPGTFCKDEAAVLGREDELRMTGLSIDDYLTTFPAIEPLQVEEHTFYPQSARRTD